MGMRMKVFLASLLVYCVWALFVGDYSMDDAFITFRYAENLVNGHGLVFNPGDSPVEGYSNFLFLLILSGLHWLGGGTLLSAKVIGLTSFALTGWLWFRRYQNDSSALWLIGPLFLLCPLTAFWGSSGLELGLHALIIVLAIHLVLERSNWAYLALALLTLSRPEGVAIAIILVVTERLFNSEKFEGRGKRLLLSLGTVFVIYAGLTLFRLAVFGHPLPNTYYAKMHHETELGFIELGRNLLLLAPLTIAFLWTCWRLLRRRINRPEIYVFAALFVSQALISARIDPVQNFLFRYLIPFMPLLLAGGLLTVSQLPAGLWRRVGLTALTLTMFAPSIDTLAKMPSFRRVLAAQDDFIIWAEKFPSSTTIAMTDMGRIPYYTGLRFHDIWGLVNEELAHAETDFDRERELALSPDYFALVGYSDSTGMLYLRFWREQQLAYDSVFHRRYRLVEIAMPEGANPRHKGYYYLIYELNRQEAP